jgi:hypothetical protein
MSFYCKRMDNNKKKNLETYYANLVKSSRAIKGANCYKMKEHSMRMPPTV